MNLFIERCANAADPAILDEETVDDGLTDGKVFLMFENRLHAQPV